MRNNKPLDYFLNSMLLLKVAAVAYIALQVYQATWQVWQAGASITVLVIFCGVLTAAVGVALWTTKCFWNITSHAPKHSDHEELLALIRSEQTTVIKVE